MVCGDFHYKKSWQANRCSTKTKSYQKQFWCSSDLCVSKKKNALGQLKMSIVEIVPFK